MTVTHARSDTAAVPGGFHFRRFCGLTIFSIVPLLYYTSHSSRLHNWLTLAVCAVVMFRVCRLSGSKKAISSAITLAYSVTFFSWLLFASLGWVSIWDIYRGDWYKSILAIEFIFAAIIMFAAKMSYLGNYQSDTIAKTVRPVALPVIPVATISAERVHLDRLRLDLESAETHGIDPSELEMAWKDKNTSQIEKILNFGSSKLDLNWKSSVTRFNSVIDIVERARLALRQRLEAAEALLTRLGMDPIKTVADGRVSLEVHIPQLRVQRDFTQRLDYTRGTTHIGTRLVTNQTSWQLALGAATIALVMGAIAHSRLLRQAAEVQGRLFERAELAEADFRQFAALIDTRLIPQHDAIVRVIGTLETLTTRISDNLGSDLSKPDAFALAFAIVEAKKILQNSVGE